MSWPLVQIGRCVEKVRTWNPTGGPECIFQYVDLSSVDKSKKIIDLDDVAEISSADAPSRARQLVVTGDVLVATVRPNLNGVAVVPAELNGATASTGYCVLRADEKNLHGRYLFYWVQTDSFVEEMMSKATGANYPAVSDKIIKESQIPLPPPARTKAHRRHPRQGRRYPPQTPASYSARRRLPPRRVSGHVRRPGEQSEGVGGQASG